MKMPQILLIALDGGRRKVPFHPQKRQIGIYTVRIEAHIPEFSIFFEKTAQILLTAVKFYSIFDPVQATMDD